MKKLFISYRRDDSAGHAGRVHDRLEREFGRDLLFMDVDAIPLGANFVKVLGAEVAKCDVLLAIIGPNWLALRSEDGSRRLDDPDDFVRIEIAAALARDIPVIPILIDGAKLPKAADLPDDLRELPQRNGINVRHDSFHSDMDRLIRGLKGGSGQGGTRLPPRSGATEEPPPAGRTPVLVGGQTGTTTRWLKPGGGEPFRDLPGGPELVAVPAGNFLMGSPEDEPERESRQKGTECPRHPVTIARPFAVGRHAVTRGQFAAFAAATGHKAEGAHKWTGSEWKHDPKASWRDPGFRQDDDHPVVCVNWDDAKAYVKWLAEAAAKPYRLLTEAEWEYAARAGTTTPFWWGSAITPAQANYDGNYVYKGGGAKGEYRKGTVPVGSFAANPWGLYNVHGNVWEWCEDVWHDSYEGAPADGSAWTTGDSSRRVARGGSWYFSPRFLRAAFRIWYSNRYGILGFRVGRTLTS